MEPLQEVGSQKGGENRQLIPLQSHNWRVVLVGRVVSIRSTLWRSD